MTDSGLPTFAAFATPPTTAARGDPARSTGARRTPQGGARSRGDRAGFRAWALGIAVCLILLGPSGPSARAAAPVYGYTVVHVYPHDPAAFTQGLIFENGVLYEGTGLYGESSLRKVELETGEVLLQRNLAPEYFGEGVTALRDTLYQLTWRNYLGFTYVERDSFERIETWPYPWDGWGLTHDGTNLITSDGSSTIRFLDPHTREELAQIQVQDAGTPIVYLNELEYIGGSIYANILGWDRIALIDPSSGIVQSWLDLAGLRDSVSSYPGAGPLNGIAYDVAENRLFVTGKLWPKLFEIEVEPLHPSEAAPPTPRTAGPFMTFSLVPNPCADRVRVSWELLPSGREAVLHLFAVDGRLLRSRRILPSATGRGSVWMDLAGLPSGPYFLRLTAGDDVTTGRLFRLR